MVIWGHLRYRKKLSISRIINIKVWPMYRRKLEYGDLQYQRNLQYRGWQGSRCFLLCTYQVIQPEIDPVLTCSGLSRWMFVAVTMQSWFFYLLQSWFSSFSYIAHRYHYRLFFCCHRKKYQSLFAPESRARAIWQCSKQYCNMQSRISRYSEFDATSLIEVISYNITLMPHMSGNKCWYSCQRYPFWSLISLRPREVKHEGFYFNSEM
jgi:hypothetical protein